MDELCRNTPLAPSFSPSVLERCEIEFPLDSDGTSTFDGVMEDIANCPEVSSLAMSKESRAALAALNLESMVDTAGLMASPSTAGASASTEFRTSGAPSSILSSLLI